MMKSILTAATFTLVSTSALAEEATPPAACESLAPGMNAETVTVKVNGMVCDFCARAVEKVFSKRDEVESVSVDLDASTITLKTSGCIKLDDETIEKLVKKSGYAFVSLERSSDA